LIFSVHQIIDFLKSILLRTQRPNPVLEKDDHNAFSHIFLGDHFWTQFQHSSALESTAVDEGEHREWFAVGRLDGNGVELID